MAWIDKTYTESFEEYKVFKEWADRQVLTFFNGYKVCIGEWVRELHKEDFFNGEIPIMNTPTWLDIYLIQNCKSQFVLDRLESVYGRETYEEFLNVDLTAKPSSSFRQHRKIKIKRNNRTKFPLHKRPYGGNRGWLLQCDDDNFWYSDKAKIWSHRSDYYPSNTNTAHIKSVKGVIRHLRRQYLPKGITFRLIGRYVGEEYTIHIK